MPDQNLIEFRRHMGALAEGLSESELAQWMATLQWIADQAIAFALRQAETPKLALLRSA